MQLQLIRSATLRSEYAGHTFVIDPITNHNFYTNTGLTSAWKGNHLRRGWEQEFDRDSM